MEVNWQKKAANILKAEITRKGLTYEQIKEKLAQIGVQESASTIALKIHRGAFQFAFFIQVMQAIGTKTIRLEEDN